MDKAKFNGLCLYWYHNKTGQRLGQYLINNHPKSVTDPEVFYCDDAHKASQLFFDRYVETG